jgi:NitT/TauT family transport system substrate-binding protein
MTMMRRPWLAFALAALAVASAPLPGLAQPKAVKVALTSKENLDNLPVFVALRMGFFTEVGLAVEPAYFRGGGEVVRAITTRSVDIGATPAASAVLIAAARGEPIKILSGGTAPLVGIVWIVAADSPVKTIRDLRGRKVGFSSPGSVSHVALQNILKEEGLDREVQLVRVGAPGDSWAAIRNKVVDAGWHISPAVYQLLATNEARIVIDAAKYIKRYQQTVVAAMEDVLRKDPEMVRRFLRARARAVKFIADEPDKTIALWADELGLPAEAVRLAYRELPRGAYEVGAPKPENLEATLAEVQGTGAIKQPPDLQAILDLTHLPR